MERNPRSVKGRVDGSLCGFASIRERCLKVVELAHAFTPSSLVTTSARLNRIVRPIFT